MTRRQTRRSISVCGATYNDFRAHCAQESRSMSAVIEDMIADLLNRPSPQPVRVPAEKPDTWKLARRASGGCIDCADGRAVGGVRCEGCAEKHRQHNRKGAGRSASARNRGTAPPAVAPRNRYQRQLANLRVTPPSEIHSQSTQSAELRPSQTHALRRQPAKRLPPGPVEKRSAPVSEARPAAVKRECAVRAEGNVRTW